MTKSEFKLHNFDKAIDFMADVNPYIISRQTMIERIEYEFKHFHDKVAEHMLKALRKNEKCNWFYYDLLAGTTKVPAQLNDADDVEKYIGFDKE